MDARNHKRILSAFLVAVGLLMVTGCSEETAPSVKLVEPASPGRDATRTCPECGRRFSLDEVKRRRPDAPHVVCPRCRKTIIPVEGGAGSARNGVRPSNRR